MKLKHYQENILSVVVIAVGGFILFNLAFLLAALVINTTQRVAGMPENEAPYIIGLLLFLLLILIISWFVLRSKLNDLAKATFLTMPLIVTIVMLGMILHQESKWIIAGAGAVVIGGVLLYLYKKKLSWLYYCSTIFVEVIGLNGLIFDVQI